MDNKTKGYIKAYRSLIDKGYYNKSQYVHLWIHLLFLANHAPKEFMFNGKSENLKPGQLITGRKKLSMVTGIKPTTIERILKVFENEQQIGQQKTNKYRVITILSWDKYQISDNKMDTKRTSNGQQTDTNNNDNNEEEVYKGFINQFNKVTGKKFKESPKTEGQFNARIAQGFTLDDLITATKNCFASDHHQKNRQYLTPEFITRQDKLEMYLTDNNSQPTKLQFI